MKPHSRSIFMAFFFNFYLLANILLFFNPVLVAGEKIKTVSDTLISTSHNVDEPKYKNDKNKSEKFTYQKCFCDIQQIWSNGNCQASGLNTIVPTLKRLYPESEILLNFVFSSVNIRNVNCSDNKIEIKIDESDGLSILNNGYLYIEQLDEFFEQQDFCFDLKERDNEIQSFVKVCIPNPTIPFCIDEDSITPSFINVFYGSNFVQLDNYAAKKVDKPICLEEAHKVTLPITNENGTLSFHFVSGEANLLWTPPPPAIVSDVWISSTDYCLAKYEKKSVTFDVKFCYNNPIIEYNKRCMETVCVRKCCPQDYIFDLEQSTCLPIEHQSTNQWLQFYDNLTHKILSTIPENLSVDYSFPWCPSKQQGIIDPLIDPEDTFFLLNNGSLFVSLLDTAMPSSLYCIDEFSSMETTSVKAIGCFMNADDERNTCEMVHGILYPILIVISCVFLVVTLIVYAVIPELHAKLHGKNLLSHVSSLLVAFLCQLMVKWSSKYLSMNLCKIIAIANQVSFLWAFFWLNVMCFDIWWTLKSMSLVPETGESCRRRFTFYSVYAWGCPLVVGSLTALIEFLPATTHIKGLIKPGFGLRGCWFQDTKSTWLYFHGFTLTLFLLNIFFFVHVATILIQSQVSTQEILKTTHKQHHKRVLLYLKLFVVMGITWICEVTSQEGTCQYWIFTDILNSLQGVMIFFIFMCNKKVFQKVQSKGVPFLRRMKALVRSPSTSSENNAVSSSQRTTTHSSDESTRRLSSSTPPNENKLVRKF